VEEIKIDKNKNAAKGTEVSKTNTVIRFVRGCFLSSLKKEMQKLILLFLYANYK
jgi:hypothetical protein